MYSGLSSVAFNPRARQPMSSIPLRRLGGAKDGHGRARRRRVDGARAQIERGEPRQNGVELIDLHFGVEVRGSPARPAEQRSATHAAKREHPGRDCKLRRAGRPHTKNRDRAQPASGTGRSLAASHQAKNGHPAGRTPAPIMGSSRTNNHARVFGFLRMTNMESGI